MIGVGAVAAWASPVLVVAVVARVAAGGVETPLFVLAVLAAPMLALLAGPGPRGARSGFAGTLSLVTVVCALGAGFRAVADLGHGAHRRARVLDRKSTRLNSSHSDRSRMPSSA